MADHAGRAWRAVTGDWKYPAALAALMFAVILGFLQYRQWTGDNDTSRLAQLAIRQNDDLRKQIDGLSSVSACRAQINATVNSTFGQVVNVQGQETAAVGQLIVAIFQQDRATLAEGVSRLAAINQLAAAANRNYQDALDKQAKAPTICAEDTSPTSTVPQEHA